MEAVKEQIEREQNNPMRKMFNENIETKTGLGVVISTLAFLLLL
jgi:pantoate kinase